MGWKGRCKAWKKIWVIKCSLGKGHLGWYFYWSSESSVCDLRWLCGCLSERETERGEKVEATKVLGILFETLSPLCLSVPGVREWFHLKHLKHPIGPMLGSEINIKIALGLFLNWMQSARAVSHHFTCPPTSLLLPLDASLSLCFYHKGVFRNCSVAKANKKKIFAT